VLPYEYKREFEGGLYVSSKLALFLFVFLAMSVSSTQAVGQSTSPAPVTPGIPAAPVCLNCHDYSQVTKATANYITSDREKVNPHRTLDQTKAKKGMASPHKSGNGVPNCENCHVAHAQPPKLSEIKKADVDSCFSACHHAGNFTPCSHCHKAISKNGNAMPVELASRGGFSQHLCAYQYFKEK
jgi:hypothetical protein